MHRWGGVIQRLVYGFRRGEHPRLFSISQNHQTMVKKSGVTHSGNHLGSFACSQILVYKII